MSTEGLLVVREIFELEDKTYKWVYLCMTTHGNGYPKEFGVSVGEFLKDIHLVNGLGYNPDNLKVANGAGCLAAQIVAHFKDRPGSIYLAQLKTNMSDYQHCYVADVLVDANNNPQGLHLTYKQNGRSKFTGSANEFLAFCSK